MTHLSDFSYLQRDAQEIYLTTYLLIKMYQADGFKCLHPRRVVNGELRSIVTWFMFLLMIAQSSWDFLCTYIKYTEGFMQVAPGIIISKPFIHWAPENQNPIEVMNYIQCVTFSLQVSILLLLQCFWNYLSNVVAKHSFMSSREFTFYIIWTVGSIAMFPILQHFYKHTDFEEIVPQFAYACEVLIVALLGFRNHTRFNRLIKVATGNGKRKDIQVADRLSYFRDANFLLSLALVAFGGSIFILCIDGFTPRKLINTNKFAADLLICNSNISSIFLWIIIISIFHPNRAAIEDKSNSTTAGTTNTPTGANNIGHATNWQESKDIPLSPIVSSPRSAHASNNNNRAYYMDSTKALNKNVDSEFEYLTSSSAEPTSRETSVTSSGLYHPTHHQNHYRPNVVSINDPYAKEPITFSMVHPGITNLDSYDGRGGNTVSYASAVDYYGVNNTNHFSSNTILSSPSSSPSAPLQTRLPSPSTPLPPPPFLGLRSTAASPPPDQELPPLPSVSHHTAYPHQSAQQQLNKNSGSLEDGL